MEVAALVSGGVDSSVTIPLLKKQGYDPVVCYIRIALSDDPAFKGCTQDEDLEIVQYLVHKYGCRLEQVDLNARRDLLAAVMKSPGPFYQFPDGSFQQDDAAFDEDAYLRELKDVTIYEARGTIDFDKLIELCQKNIFV